GLSLLVGLAGVYLLDARPSLRVLVRRHAAEAVVVGLILAAGLVLRLFNLSELPFGLWSDEAASGNEVVRILRDPSYRPVLGTGWAQGIPAMAWYLTVPFVAALGPTQLA